jgi:hypothetical protein
MRKKCGRKSLKSEGRRCGNDIVGEENNGNDLR